MKNIYFKRHILCIDLKSFFASVECVERGLDPFKYPLVVANPTQGDGAITLAVTPYLKAQGVKSRGRLYEIPKDVKPIINISVIVNTILGTCCDNNSINIILIYNINTAKNINIKCNKNNLIRFFSIKDLVLFTISLDDRFKLLYPTKLAIKYK